MKKALLIFVMIFISLSFASAAYECSDGKAFDSQSKEISENEEKEINGIGIGITDASESAVLDKITANLLIDASKITLSNTTNSEDVMLLTGEYTVQFINISGSETRIKVEGDTENAELEELTTIDETQVYVTSIDSNNNEIDLIIGISQLTLSNTDNPEEVVTIEDIDYLISLVSASSSSASISVKTCSSNSIVEISSPVVNNTNTTTNTNNQTNVTDTTNNSQSNTNLDTNATNASVEQVDSEIIEKYNPLNYLSKNWYVYIPTVLIIIVFIYLGIRYFKNKKLLDNVKKSDTG